MRTVAVPKLCLLEHLTPKGWIKTGTFSLLHPENYVTRLRDKGKFGRATILDDKLLPNGRVYVSDDVPRDPSILVRTDEGNVPWKLPDPAKTCPVCAEEHRPPYDGSCLL